MDDDKRNHTKTSFSSYSKVCYSDPKNPGKMICKESNNKDGNKQVKEYFFDTNEQISINSNNNSFTDLFSNFFRKPIERKDVHNLEENDIRNLLTMQEQIVNKMFNESPLVSILFPSENNIIFDDHLFFDNTNDYFKKVQKKRPDVYHSYKIYEV